MNFSAANTTQHGNFSLFFHLICDQIIAIKAAQREKYFSQTLHNFGGIESLAYCESVGQV
jgi:hypothetical protein